MMLEEYKDKQFELYTILKNEIVNNQISHAYLFDENNNSESFDIIMSFVKEIFCSEISSLEEKKRLCMRIDEGNFSEISIIRPDGLVIKKQQLMDLQKDFSKSAIESGRRVYIICDCEKMRPEAANSMLKFLEEPDNNIIAILMTNNFNSVLSTIVSRCQLIRLCADNVVKCDVEFSELALNFIKCIENDGIRAILSMQNLLFSAISTKERDKLINFFDIVVDMYYDILKIIIGNKNIKYAFKYDDLLLISKKCDYNDVLIKINEIIMAKDAIKNNVNCNLLIDSLILKIGG